MSKTRLPLSLSLSLLALAAADAAFARPAAAQYDTNPLLVPGAPGLAKPVAATDPAVGNRLFQQAIAQTKAGKYAAAEATYKKLLKLFPTAAPAWANLGLLAARANRTDEAAADLRKAIALTPGNAEFLAQLASVELRRGVPKNAEAAARKALAVDPANAVALGNLAGALMAQGKNEDAIEPLKKLLAASGDKNPQAGFSLAVAYGRTGRKADALALAKKLAAQDPKQPNYQLILGDLSAQTGDYAAARKAYAKLYDLMPSDARAGINAAVAAEMQGDVAGAEAWIEKVAAGHPRDPLVQYNLGRLRYRIAAKPDDFVKAADAFGRAVLLDPKNPLYLTNNGLALAFAGSSHYQEAEKYLLSALNVDDRSATAQTAHMGLAYVYEQQKRFTDAVAQYRAVLEIAPAQYDARRRLAGLLYAGGKKDEAYQEFRTLAEKTPGPAGAKPLKELASLLTDDKKYEDARQAYEQALARDPKDVEALDGLGLSWVNLKEPAKAQEKYAAALALSPTDLTAYTGLYGILREQGKTDDLIALTEKFVAANPASNAARWQLAQLYVDRKRDDDALSEMRKLTIQRGDPLHVAYLLGPAGLMSARGRYADAVAEIQTLLPQNPADAVELRYALAEAQMKASQLADAEKTAAQLAAEAKTPEAQTRANLLLADLSEKRSQWDDAGHYYETVLMTDAASLQGRAGLWRVRQKQGKPEAAAAFLESLAVADAAKPNETAIESVRILYQEQHTPEKFTAFAKRVSEKYPKDRAALNVYAQALLQAVGSPGEKDARTQAAAVFRQMTALDPGDADAFFQLGSQEEKLGHQDDAIAAYRSAVTTRASAQVANMTAAENARQALQRLKVPVIPPSPTPTVTIPGPGVSGDKAPAAAEAPPAPTGKGAAQGVPKAGS